MVRFIIKLFITLTMDELHLHSNMVRFIIPNTSGY